ncbi:hypothetical protein OA501_01645 [Flavobacteriaceae bacterium]|nr:hypothetical protein [Flavobacteriaceae bacterium]
MKKHSRINRFLHRLYLKNYFISKSSLEYEIDRYGDKIVEENKLVFISGLARSGTTTFLREIHDSKKFASLQYRNMPFLFLPNTYQIKSVLKPSERAHGDSIKVNGDSPEEFDEYFWKVYLKDSFIKKDSLVSHDINDEILKKYSDYTKLVCLSKKKQNYITKNNNNILRVPSLIKLPSSVFFFLVRKPIDHVSSLIKLHKKFSQDHINDSFSLEYFNLLGHHEFGMNHKPFNLLQSHYNNLRKYDPDKTEYWLLIWKQYYQYLLNIYEDKFNLIFFEDLINEREKVNKYVNNVLQISITNENKNFKPPIYKDVPKD